MEHIQKLAVRRIAQLDLARGFSAWLSQYGEQQRVMQLLRHAGGRLSKPKLVSSFVEWRDDWHKEQVEQERAAAAAAHEQRLMAQRAELDAQLAQVRDELGSSRSSATDKRRELEEALAEARSLERTVVIHVPVDRYVGVPDYGSFWDVPVAEVSEMEPVRTAREQYDKNRRAERWYL